MIVSIGDKIMKNITFCQITYGDLIDFRNDKDEIIYQTSMNQLKQNDMMIFIHSDEKEESYETNKNLKVIGSD